MVKYRCNVCKVYEYDETRGNSPTGIKPGTNLKDFPENWKCPICKSDKTHLKPIEGEIEPSTVEGTIVCPRCGIKHKVNITSPKKVDLNNYLGESRRTSDDLEKHMESIHTISATQEFIIEPMRTQMNVISWDDILIKGAQLAKIPLNQDEKVNTKTRIGPKAKHPLVIETPIVITHMSFGALSKEVKIALATGSAAVKTAMSSGNCNRIYECILQIYL